MWRLSLELSESELELYELDDELSELEVYESDYFSRGFVEFFWAISGLFAMPEGRRLLFGCVAMIVFGATIFLRGIC